jgi:hypothetical protein
MGQSVGNGTIIPVTHSGAILERLPEGDETEHDIFLRSAEQADIDEWADDGADGE